MNEQERYSEICKPAFDGLKADTQEILKILKGRNGDPGLLDEVRELKQLRKTILGGFLFLFTTLFVQAMIWLRSKFGG